MAELNSVCNIELRIFNLSVLPANTHHPKQYSWKITVITVDKLRISPIPPLSPPPPINAPQ